MKTILLTGATGFMGKNLAPMLENKYSLLKPTRNELNLLDGHALKVYLEKVDRELAAVIHCAFPTGHNPIDKKENMIEDTLNIFSNFEKCNSFYKKFIYFGSGAEYGKNRSIKDIKEEEIGHVVPEDVYGFVRYQMNEMAKHIDNAFNLRIFGCYGPYDPPHKFITHVLNCIICKEPITIKQNTFFDYLYVGDLHKILEHFLEYCPKYKDYNVATGVSVDLKTIAEIAKGITNSDSEIVISNQGLGLEYTASNQRLLTELAKGGEDEFKFTPMEEGITKLYRFMTPSSDRNF